jgi:hypothetical protein
MLQYTALYIIGKQIDLGVAEYELELLYGRGDAVQQVARCVVPTENPGPERPRVPVSVPGALCPARVSFDAGR